MIKKYIKPIVESVDMVSGGCLMNGLGSGTGSGVGETDTIDPEHSGTGF